MPEVVLMDLELPGMSGLEGIARIKAASPASQIIVLTIHEDNDRVLDALCAGAVGYPLKPASGASIIDAVTTARSGGAPMNAFVAERRRT